MHWPRLCDDAAAPDRSWQGHIQQGIGAVLVVVRALEVDATTQRIDVDASFELLLALRLQVRVAQLEQCRTRDRLTIHERGRELLLRDRRRGGRLHAGRPVGGAQTER